MDLFDLSAKISLDTNDFKSGLESAGKTVGSFMSTIGGGLKGAVDVGICAMTAVVDVVGKVGSTFSDAITSTAQYGDEIDKTSQKLGLSAQSYQEWDYVMNLAGTSMSNMSVGLKTLTNKLDSAKGGSAEAQEMFAKLGLSMEELDGLSREELFEKTIAGFQNLEDSADRASLANDLFGKSGQELTPLFNMTNKQTAEAIAQLNEYGGVMSDDAVKASADFTDAITTLKASFNGLSKGVTAEFLPSVTGIVEGFTKLMNGDAEGADQIKENIQNIADTIKDNMPIIEDTIRTILPIIADLIVELAPLLVDVAQTLLETLAEYVVQNAPSAFSNVADILDTIIDYLIEGLPQFADTALEMVLALANGIAENAPEVIPKIAELIATLINAIANHLPEIIVGAYNLFIGLATGILKALPIILNALGNLFVKLFEFLGKKGSELLTAGGEIVESIAQGIKDNFAKITDSAKEMIDKIKDKIKTLASTIKGIGRSIVESIWDGISGAYDWIVGKLKTWVDNVVAYIKKLFGLTDKDDNEKDKDPSKPNSTANSANPDLIPNSPFVDLKPTADDSLLNAIKDLNSNLSALSVNVTLEGDAGQIFRTVQKQSKNYTRQTGRPAFS